MVSSATVPSPPPPAPLSSCIDDGGDESEYEEIEEEIEVEEEVEIEEEVEMELVSEEEAAENPVKSEAPNEIGEDLTPAPTANQDNGDNAIQSVVVESNHTAIEAVGDQSQMAPSLHLPQIRSRIPSSSDEFNVENKKLRMACEFHAKGWCIRGSSCRFLHINNGPNVAVKSSELLEKNASSSVHIITPQRSWDFSRDVFYSHPRQPSYFGTSSWNTNAHRTQNIRESGPELQGSIVASSQRSYIPVSRSISEALSLNHKSRAGPTNYEAMFSSWEPSIPFCASHEITRNLISKKNLKDPIHESIDEKDGKKIISHSDQGSSVKDINVESNIPKVEDKTFNSSHADDKKEDNTISSDDGKLKLDKARDEPVLDVGGSNKTDEFVVIPKKDSQIPSEANEFKIFHSALIEFVKELVKPTWREGLLSRDAHKLIVKKSVDRILVTIPPELIPRTSEHTHHYLSTCTTKIEELVKAYIKKYGTFKTIEPPQP